MEDIFESAMMDDNVTMGMLDDRLDPLTGINGRKGLEVGFKSMSKALSPGSSLVLFNIDSFHALNDFAGKTAGDELLRMVASSLRDALGHEFVARLDADNFIAIITPEHVSRRGMASSVESIISSLICEAFSMTTILGADLDPIYFVRLSAGYVEIDLNQDLDLMLSKAASACRYAKSLGGNCLINYVTVSNLDDISVNCSTWGVKVMRAIRDENYFKLYVQPIVDKDKNTVYHEVLLRLEYDGETYAPGVFLPAARALRLSSFVDEWVIVNTFMFIDSTGFDGGLSINLTPESVACPRVLGTITECVETFNVNPKKITFELTEERQLTEIDGAADFLYQLKAFGFSISLDDFGSGSAGFKHMKMLPIDFLKFDGSFVRGVEHNEMDQSIISAVSMVCMTHGIRTVAEFVEDQEKMDMLIGLGVDLFQGYLFSKPYPISGLIESNEAAVSC